MKRKYDCPKVKIGDWVYICYCGDESKYSYKVVKIGVSVYGGDMITVEVGNKKDSFIGGWGCESIGKGQYWNVTQWKKKHSSIIEIE
jgi:hypothetical protein